jgi:hypothetical protein
VSTTTDINRALSQFHAGDERATQAIIEFAHGRLMLLARGVLRGFPDVRRTEETAAILNQAYKRITDAMRKAWAPRAGGDRSAPPAAADLICLAAQHIRWQLIELARKERGRGEPRPPKRTVGPADSERPGVDPPLPDPASAEGLNLDVAEAVESLRLDLRTIVELHVFGGLTLKDVAQLLGLSYDQAKDRWSEARLDLAETLAAYRSLAE